MTERHGRCEPLPARQNSFRSRDACRYRRSLDPAMDGWIDLIVARIGSETRSIRTVELRPSQAGALPGWDPGAHIKVRLPDGDHRSYSLLNLSTAPACVSPEFYLLGVRLEDPGKGGSRFMHGLKPG